MSSCGACTSRLNKQQQATKKNHCRLSASLNTNLHHQEEEPACRRQTKLLEAVCFCLRQAAEICCCVLLLHYSTPTVGVSLEILTSLESCNWILCTDDLPTLFAIHFRGDFAISVVYIVIDCNYMHLLKYCTLKILRFLYFTWVFPFCATLYVNSTSCWSKCCTLYFTSHQSSTFVNEFILSAIRFFLKKYRFL